MTQDQIELPDALRVLAFMGDLSMGQPTDHSPRVARLARRLGQSTGLADRRLDAAVQVAWLRWSGCTANAGVAESAVADDVRGRAAMLAMQQEFVAPIVGAKVLAEKLAQLSDINCEVSASIAKALGLDEVVPQSLEAGFERWDGSGRRGLRGDQIPPEAQLVRMASELEILSRVHGLPAALSMLQQRSGAVHAPDLFKLVQEGAARWLSELDLSSSSDDTPGNAAAPRPVALALVADVIDLKLPWLLGSSRALARLSQDLGRSIKLHDGLCDVVRRAAYLHGLGRAAIPNSVWNRHDPLTPADWERARLSPYWTSRAAAQIPGLASEAEFASRVYERLDGSGYFRGSRHADTSLAQRVLPVASTWLSLRSARPWRDAFIESQAVELLRREAAVGRLDQMVVKAMVSQSGVTSPGLSKNGDTCAVLTAREIEVLRRVSAGDSNKEVAVQLGISPTTVRKHLESTFRKLDCKSRAAATLKATWLGLV